MPCKPFRISCLTRSFHARWAIESLKDTSFFLKHAPDIPAADLDTLRALGERWTQHMESGVFKLSIPTSTPLGAPSAADFWTTQWSYQFLPEQAPELLKELKGSSLVIFKGDLNYRKCVLVCTESG